MTTFRFRPSSLSVTFRVGLLSTLLVACARTEPPMAMGPAHMARTPAADEPAAGEGKPEEAASAVFDVVEATIAGIHQAMLAGELTAVELVDAYLARIAAYDRTGPALNALIVVNPRARDRAAELDAELERTGRLSGPLHGIPVIVKDNYDTRDLPTTAGSASLASSVPPDDAFQVRRIREAGAIVLAKSNMAEFAFSPYETVGSALPGYTRNPYATNRVTAGSSGGTAAAVAASFGAVGLGTDTGNSIRGPSGHQALAGIRSTMGLTSRDGIIPLYLDRDIGGPMARTVADAVAVFDVIAGTDPADPWTAEADAHLPAGGYLQFLAPAGLEGARIGVLRALSDTETADPEVLRRFEEAIRDLEAGGAIIVDPADIPGYDDIRGSALFCRRFRPDINAYLASLGDDAPVRTLEEIIEGGRVHPTIEQRLEFMMSFPPTVEENEGCAEVAENAERLRQAVTALFDGEGLDAVVYPTWNNPARLIGDLTTPHGNNSWQLSPPTGFPAVTVPMGWVHDGLPVGLQILGRPWSEPTLIRLAYAYEQATMHRRAPPTTPPLDRGPPTADRRWFAAWASVEGYGTMPGGAPFGRLPQRFAAPHIALVGGTLVDGTGAPAVEDAVVVIRDGVIDCVGPRGACRLTDEIEIVDVSGQWLVPGLIDAHVHYSQTGWADGRPDALDMRERFPYARTVADLKAHPDRFFRSYLCSGVTATFDVGGYPWTWGLRDYDSDITAPHVAAAGPLLSTRDHWLNVPGERQFLHIATDSAVEAGADFLLANGTDAIKIWFLHGASSPDSAGWRHRVELAAQRAREAGVPLIVHATGLWQAKVAVRNGAHLLVHSVYDQPVDDEFLDLARRAGTIYNPTLIVSDGYVQLRTRAFEADAYGDGLACVDPGTLAKAFLGDSLPGAPDAETARRMRESGEARNRLMVENLRRVHGAGIPIAMGTDAGNPLTLHGPSVYLEMEAMQAAGMSPMEVLTSSTLIAARALGRALDLGSVEAGKVADLVVLGADPLADIRNVRQVELIVRGGVVHRRGELEY